MNKMKVNHSYGRRGESEIEPKFVPLSFRRSVPAFLSPFTGENSSARS